MIDQIARAIAASDRDDFHADQARYRWLAVALARPSEAMIDTAYGAVWFDDAWAINSRRDFEKAVQAIVLVAIKKGAAAGG